jgi:hypothetical protein
MFPIEPSFFRLKVAGVIGGSSVDRDNGVELLDVLNLSSLLLLPDIVTT